MRCALTTPFHPYREKRGRNQPELLIDSEPDSPGGIFSVALSVGLRLPDVIWHPVLWSPDFPLSNRESDCLADLHT